MVPVPILMIISPIALCEPEIITNGVVPVVPAVFAAADCTLTGTAFAGCVTTGAAARVEERFLNSALRISHSNQSASAMPTIQNSTSRKSRSHPGNQLNDVVVFTGVSLDENQYHPALFISALVMVVSAVTNSGDHAFTKPVSFGCGNAFPAQVNRGAVCAMFATYPVSFLRDTEKLFTSGFCSDVELQLASTSTVARTEKSCFTFKHLNVHLGFAICRYEGIDLTLSSIAYSSIFVKHLYLP